MGRPFYQSTAELTVQVSEAVCISPGCNYDFAKDFCDLSSNQTSGGLNLAVDLGLIKEDNKKYYPESPFVRFLCTPNESDKAAIIRVVLESFEPFKTFRERLMATGSVDAAAQQTKVVHDLEAHREDIKDTLVSLGTYTKAIHSEGGGKYIASGGELTNQLKEIADNCSQFTDAEACVRVEIGDYADRLERDEVICPLSSALLKSKADKPVEAVSEAASAVESYLARLADRLGVNLAGASGLNNRLEKFRADNKLPKKIIESGKYLVQVRNAADHGVDVDPDVGSVWKLLNSTGVQYVFVACSFIRACGEREANGDFLI